MGLRARARCAGLPPRPSLAVHGAAAKSALLNDDFRSEGAPRNQHEVRVTQQFYKNMALWVVILLMILLLVTMLRQSQTTPADVPFSKFLAQVEAGEVAAVTIEEGRIEGRLGSGQPFTTYAPAVTDKLLDSLDAKNVEVTARPARESPMWQQILIMWFPFLLLIGLWVFFMRQVQSGGGKAMSFGKSRARLLNESQQPRDLRRRRGRRRVEGRTRRDHRVPARPEEVHAPRRPHSEGRAAGRPAGHRQDAAGEGGGGRSGRPVLLDLGLRLRRDVRRRRRVARARPVPAGQEERTVHHLHRRDRRSRASPRRRSRRRSRRARADAEPAARRDGRLRKQRGRDPGRRDQPPRRARPGAAAPRPLRPPRRRAAPGLPRSLRDPEGPHAPRSARRRRRSRDHRPRHAGLRRRRSAEPRERGRAARGASRRHHASR